MSYCDDLIDLSSEGNFCAAIQLRKREDVILVPQDAAVFSSAGQEQRFSFDNPFDCALRKTALENDPFEIVAQQIEDQRLAGVPRCVEVETGNLLDLDDNGIAAGIPSNFAIRQLHEDPEGSEKVSLIEHLNGTTASDAEERKDTSSVVFTTSKTNVSDRNIKVHRLSNGDIRTQLLKSSVSGSPLGPLRRRSSKSSEDGSEKNISYGSMHVNVSEFNDSCDDIYAIKPNWVDSETEQDSDLEQLKIPMLQQIDDDSEKKASERDHQKNNVNNNNQTTFENGKPSNGSQNKIDLEMIRDRVKRHKSGKSSPQDVDELISSMKHIVSECSDESQRFEASQLLESLSTLLCKKSPEPTEDKSKAEALLDVPKPMVRQGTFDLDKSKSPNNFMANDNEPLGGADIGVHETQESLPCSENQELPSILEQIGRLLGNQNINVLQTNLSSTENSGQNPTYIVVMGASNAHVPVTPIRQHTQILINNPTSPEFEQMPRNRSQSLSLHDKSAKRKSIVTPSSPSVFTTPTRPPTLKRRSTISFSPGHSSANQTTDSQKQSNLQRRQSLNSDRNAYSYLPKIAGKNMSNMGMEPNEKSLKVKANECTRRTVGPLKATVPVKKVLPMVTTPSNLTSNRETLDSKLLTSTPIAVSSTSISSIKSSPHRLSVGKNKLHSPFLSATPNMKASTKSSLSGLHRRRSLTDSKSTISTTNSSSSKTSANPSQFLRRSTFGISHKTTPTQPRNKENACPK